MYFITVVNVVIAINDTIIIFSSYNNNCYGSLDIRYNFFMLYENDRPSKEVTIIQYILNNLPTFISFY